MGIRSVRHYGPYSKTVALKGGKKPSQKGVKAAMGSPKIRKSGAHTETKTKVAMGKLRDKRTKKR